MILRMIDALAELDSRLSERAKEVLAVVAIAVCLAVVAFIEGHTPGATYY